MWGGGGPAGPPCGMGIPWGCIMGGPPWGIGMPWGCMGEGPPGCMGGGPPGPPGGPLWCGGIIGGPPGPSGPPGPGGNMPGWREKIELVGKRQRGKYRELHVVVPE